MVRGRMKWTSRDATPYPGASARLHKRQRFLRLPFAGQDGAEPGGGEPGDRRTCNRRGTGGSLDMKTYPIITVTPESVLESEQLGTKDKFWFNTETDDEHKLKSQWLFKFPTEGTGQHWAEKIACEIAKQMKILTPRVELGSFQGVPGSITENFTNDGYELFHGNQILAGFEPDYKSEQMWHQNDHTVRRIFAAINAIFLEADATKKASDQMASYLVLDALICNVDRHHENWGILRKTTPEGMRGRLAPSYDHASSWVGNCGIRNRRAIASVT